MATAAAPLESPSSSDNGVASSPLFSHLTLMLRYHRWATALLLRAVASLSEEEYRRDCGLAFRSVHGTLVHLQAADALWLRRMTDGGQTGNEHLWADGVTGAQWEQHIPDRDEVAQTLTAGAEAFAELLARTPASELESLFHYKNTRGVEMSQQRSFILLHVANHGTHHRGQISAALTQLSHPAPALDLLYMLNEKA